MQDDVRLASYAAELARTVGTASAGDAYDVVSGPSLDHKDDVEQLMRHQAVAYVTKMLDTNEAILTESGRRESLKEYFILREKAVQSPVELDSIESMTGDPLCRFFTQSQTCRLSRIFEFVAGRSFTADSSLLQPTGGVNTTPHTLHFLTDSHAHAWLKSCVCRARITCHDSSSCAHVFVLTLFDYSIFLSLMTIFSLIILSFLLPINFIFHDVVDKFPVHFR